VPLFGQLTDEPPARAEPLSTLSCRASPGERAPVAVLIGSSETLRELRITATDLDGPSGRLPFRMIDVRIARAWQQAGTGPVATTPSLVWELLLKDDRVILRDDFDAQGHYLPPALGRQDITETDLDPGIRKLVWITVRVPPDARPGSYLGALEFEGKLVGEPPKPFRQRLPLSVHILSLALEEPRFERLIFYRGSLDPGSGLDYVTEPILSAELADIREEGFTGVTVYGQQKESAGRQLELTRAAGFRGPVVFMDFSQEPAERARSLGLQPLFFGVDEPRDEARLQRHLAKSRLIHSHQLPVVTTILDSHLVSRLSDRRDLNEPLDIACYLLTPLHVQQMLSQSLPRGPRSVWYYWQSMMERPALHRFLAGFFLWRSGVNGIFPYVYQHIFSRDAGPYSEGTLAKGALRPHMTTYPSREGPIPTLQWEAIREGIDDLRYLVTLEREIARTSSCRGPSGLRARLNAQNSLRRLSSEVEAAASGLDLSGRRASDGTDAARYEAWRNIVVDGLLDLVAACPR
jgi:hypothetical protein